MRHDMKRIAIVGTKLGILATVFAFAPSLGAQATPAAPSTEAHPFGVTFGMSLDALKKLVPLTPVPSQPYFFGSTTAPAPHSKFATYMYVVTPAHGLCVVMGTSAAEASDAYGQAAYSTFYDVADALAGKYGKSHRLDELRAGSIWDEPRDWMMGLFRKERVLSDNWTAGSSPLPAPLLGIALSESALSPNTVQLTIIYSVKDGGACIAEAKSAMNGSL